MVMVDDDRYKELLEKELLLDLLDLWGVDNWGGYGYAIRNFKEDKEGYINANL